MKTKKLNLNELKVESFVTSLKEKKSETVKGGSTAVCGAATASTLPCGTVVVATVVIVATATIVGTANPNVVGANSQCCSYLNPDQCGGNGNTFNPDCV